MGISLKDQNRPMLAVVLMANIATYSVLMRQGIAIGSWSDALVSSQGLIPGVLVTVLTGVISAQIDHTNKARLVFWKWSDPLPGCRAFTKYAAADPRVDTEALKKYQDPLPTAPKEQNTLWFRWFREHQDDAGVNQAHREYLFTRDYAGISILLILGLGPLALWQMGSAKVAGIYICLLIVQYLLVRRAAKNHGIRLVASVLAYKASADLMNEGTQHGDVFRD